MSLGRVCRIWLVAALMAAGVVVVSAGPAAAATITSSGPLTSIAISPDLTCAVTHVDDRYPEWFAETACGTLISLNGELYGPNNIPSGGGATPRTFFTPVSQSAVTGSGTAADPYTIVTVVRAGDRATLTQTDRYVVGQEFYRTEVRVANNSGARLTGHLYTAGDCYLQDSDFGYGQVIGTAPACAASTLPGSRLVSLIPSTGGNAYYQANYNEVWTRVGAQLPFPNTCRCDEYLDNGIGISWPVNLSAGESSTWGWRTNFSPQGHVPLIVTASAHSPSSPPGDLNGYRITVQNGNPERAPVNRLTVTLPPGFTYVTGSTIGATRADPAISGQTLTWSGPLAVPGGGEITIDFNVRVTRTAGTYTIDATATAPEHEVTPALDAAPITVSKAADLGLTKIPSVAEVARGGAFTYTLTARNHGPSAEPAAYITDTLPTGFAFNAAQSSSGCFAIGQAVRCNIGALAPGGSASATVGVRVASNAPEGFAYNFAEVHGDVPDPNPINNPVSAPVLVSNNALAISKIARPVFAGDDLTWTIGVINDGTSAATGGIVADTLPSGLTFVRATTTNGTCGFEPTSRTVTCTLGTIAAGASATITIVTGTPPQLVPAGQTSTTVTDTASVTHAGVTDTTTFPVRVFAGAHLVPRKTVTPATVVAGRRVTYRPAVLNQGPSVATNITVTDTLPRGLTFAPAASDQRCGLIDPAAGTVRCVAPGPLAVGATVTFTVVAWVDATLGDRSTIVNDAVATAFQYDPDPAPSARAASVVVRRVDLAVTKKASRRRVRAGESLKYTITVVNRGPSAASAIVLRDRVSKRGLTGGLRRGKGAWRCPVIGVAFRCLIPELLPGDRLTLTVPVKTPAKIQYPIHICNTVTATSAERDLRPANNKASACVKIIPKRRKEKPILPR
jgi:uncharacterized repeat protein (TIGR01451 family)